MDGTTQAVMVPKRRSTSKLYRASASTGPGDASLLAVALKATEAVINLLGLAEHGAAQPASQGVDLEALAQSTRRPAKLKRR